MSPSDDLQVLLSGNEQQRMALASARKLEEYIDERIKKRFEEYAANEAKRMDARFDELKDLLKSAFPDGDADGHRRYHEEAIEYMRDRRELWKSVREKSIAGLTWALIAGLGAAVWHYLKATLGAPG